MTDKDNTNFWLLVILFSSILCIVSLFLAYTMKYNPEFSHLMIYENETDITEIRKRRRSWDIIDKDVILRRFD